MNDFKKKIYNLFPYYCELLGININSGSIEHINVINQIYIFSKILMMLLVKNMENTNLTYLYMV